MSQAKQKKLAAARTKAATALLREIGLPLPPPMTKNPDAEAVQWGFNIAINSLQEFLKAKETLKSQPNERVNYILGLVRDHVYAPVDASASDLLASLEVACRKGCAWCCHQNVEVSIPEAIYIAVETGAPGDSRGAAVDQAAEKFANIDDVTRAKTGDPCPFLGADQACTIYDVRPTACRAFFSPDVEGCKSAFERARIGDMSGVVTSHGLPQILGLAHRTAIDALLKDLGLQYDDVDLVSTVASIRRNPNLIESWAAGEHVFKPRPTRIKISNASLT